MTIHPPHSNASPPSYISAASCSSVALGIRSGGLVTSYDDDDEYLDDDLMLELEKAEQEYSAGKSLQNATESLTCDMSQSTHLQSQEFEVPNHTQDTLAPQMECHSQEDFGDKECHSQETDADQECHSQEIDDDIECHSEEGGGDKECHSQETDADQECHSEETDADQECHSQEGGGDQECHSEEGGGDQE